MKTKEVRKMNIKEYSILVNKSIHAIQKKITKGKIPGVKKINGKWDIPTIEEKHKIIKNVDNIDLGNIELDFIGNYLEKKIKSLKQLQQQKIELEQITQIKKQGLFEIYFNIISDEIKQSLCEVEETCTGLKLNKNDIIIINQCIKKSIPKITENLIKSHLEYN